MTAAVVATDGSSEASDEMAELFPALLASFALDEVQLLLNG